MQSDGTIENAFFCRLRNIELSWRLPAQWLRSARLNNCRLYLQAQNLFTITKYTGYDPEIGSRYQNSPGNTLINGIDYGQFPSPRTVMGGVQIGF